MSLTVGSIFILHVHLAEAKIAKSDVTRVIKKNILRLQISINNVEAM